MLIYPSYLPIEKQQQQQTNLFFKMKNRLNITHTQKYISDMYFRPFIFPCFRKFTSLTYIDWKFSTNKSLGININFNANGEFGRESLESLNTDRLTYFWKPLKHVIQILNAAVFLPHKVLSDKTQIFRKKVRRKRFYYYFLFFIISKRISNSFHKKVEDKYLCLSISELMKLLSKNIFGGAL